MAEFRLQKMLEFCSKSFGVELDNFASSLKKNRYALATGQIDEKEFWVELASRNHVAVPSYWRKKYQNMIKHEVKPRLEMYRYVQSLKEAGFQVAMLSDVTAWQADVFRQLDLYQEFSPVLLSCEIGERKPNKRVYMILLDRLKVSPEECIFIDDRLTNVEAACKLGIQGILYTTFEEIKESIEEKLCSFH